MSIRIKPSLSQSTSKFIQLSAVFRWAFAVVRVVLVFQWYRVWWGDVEGGTVEGEEEIEKQAESWGRGVYAVKSWRAENISAWFRVQHLEEIAETDQKYEINSRRHQTPKIASKNNKLGVKIRRKQFKGKLISQTIFHQLKNQQKQWLKQHAFHQKFLQVQSWKFHEVVFHKQNSYQKIDIKEGN